MIKLECYESYYAQAVDHSSNGTNLLIHETGDIVFCKKYLPVGTQVLCSITHLANPDKHWRAFAVIESIFYRDIA